MFQIIKISSNSSFSGVSNEIYYDKVNAGTVSTASLNAGSVRTGTINCDSVQISLPKTAATVKITWDASSYYNLKTEDMSLMTRGIVLYDDNGAISNGTLGISTADTAAEALRLLSLFNITDTTITRLITFSRINTITAGMISIGAYSGVNSRDYVTYMTNSVAPNPHANLGSSGSSRKSYVLVYRGSDYLNNKTIVFDVIGQAT